MKTAALLTNMHAPIGNMIGNSLEVVEAIEGLHGQAPEDLNELVERLGGHTLFLCGHVDSVLDGWGMINSVMQDGTAVKMFCAMLKAQGVEPDLADKLCSTGADVRGLLPKSKRTTEVCCQANGELRVIVHHDEDKLPVHILDILNQAVVVKSTTRTGLWSRLIDVIYG